MTRTAATVARFDGDLERLAGRLVDVMGAAGGVGLAAPQLGCGVRVMVMSPDGEPVVLVNPRVIDSFGSCYMFEGCLSVPGLDVELERASRVEVAAFDVHGEPVRCRLRGFAARVALHEIDHLDGVTLLDRVGVGRLPKGFGASLE